MAAPTCRRRASDGPASTYIDIRRCLVPRCTLNGLPPKVTRSAFSLNVNVALADRAQGLRIAPRGNQCVSAWAGQLTTRLPHGCSLAGFRRACSLRVSSLRRSRGDPDPHCRCTQQDVAATHIPPGTAAGVLEATSPSTAASSCAGHSPAEVDQANRGTQAQAAATGFRGA